MPSVADALRQHAPEYLQRFGQTCAAGPSQSHRRRSRVVAPVAWAESTTSAMAVVASTGSDARVAIGIARTVATKSHSCG